MSLGAQGVQQVDQRFNIAFFVHGFDTAAEVVDSGVCLVDDGLVEQFFQGCEV